MSPPAAHLILNRISINSSGFNFAESKARIIGGSDVHVKSGSSLRLTCEVDHGPHDIAQVLKSIFGGN
jgi:hypothetical protein